MAELGFRPPCLTFVGSFLLPPSRALQERQVQNRQRFEARVGKTRESN